MNYVRQVTFTLLFVTVSAFEKDILIAIGVSVVGTLLFCLILSLLIWRFCMRDSDPTKHQFDPELIVNPYSYESTNGEVCSSCGNRVDRFLKDVPEERKESEQKKAEEVIVMIHSNTSTAPPSESVAEQNIHRLQPDNLSFMVHLIKTDTGSLGLSIVGGRSSRLGDIGIFIKSILQDSPAEHNGQLKPWDQILVVNDRSFDGITIHEALAILKSIRNEVYLTILPSEIATAKLEASLKKSGTILEDEEDTKGVDDVDIGSDRGKRYGRSTAEISYAETERYFPDEDEDVFANSETLSDLSHDLTPMYGTPIAHIKPTNGITVNSSPDILQTTNHEVCRLSSNIDVQRDSIKEEVIAVMVHDPPKQTEPSSTPRTSAHLRDFTLECEEEDLDEGSELFSNNIPEMEVNEKSCGVIEFEEPKYSADQIRIRYNNETAVVCNGNT